MNVKKAIAPLEQSLTFIAKWVAYITAVITLVSIVIKIFEWGKSGPLAFLANNILILWMISLSFSTLVLWLWVSSLHRRFTQGFSDNLRVVCPIVGILWVSGGFLRRVPCWFPAQMKGA